MTQENLEPANQEETGQSAEIATQPAPETIRLSEEMLQPLAEPADVPPPLSPTVAIEAPEASQTGEEPAQPPATGSVQPARTPPPPPVMPAAPPRPLSPSEERTWAMLANLSVLANLVTGFLGPVIALIIYLVFKNRSRYVAYQSMQAFLFQLIWWVGAGFLAGIAWAISGVLAAVLIGCCLMPFAILISLVPIGALVYGVIGAIQTNQGLDFKYWLIGDWVRGILEG